MHNFTKRTGLTNLEVQLGAYVVTVEVHVVTMGAYPHGYYGSACSFHTWLSWKSMWLPWKSVITTI